MKIGVNWRNFVKENLKGKGLEIGALHAPMAINDETTMVYQDRLELDELKTEVANNNKAVDVNTIIKASVISDAESVPFENGYFDFVVNSHVFEHLKNPLKALFEWLRVTKTGGYVYMVVPDMRFIFDKDRKVTSGEHIFQDFVKGVREVELAHYEDFYVNVHRVIKELARPLYEKQGSVHVHTFTEDSLLELLNRFAPTSYEIVDYKRYNENICVVIKKL